MPGLDLSSLEQQYGLPPGILTATMRVESGGRDVTSRAGAEGPFQITPPTARALGVNPHDPVQAANGAARLWRQNLDASGGDIDRAAKMYNAGPDPRHWNNPETQAYPGKLVAALTSGQPAPAPQSPPAQPPATDPHDPFEHALAGNTPSANDPFEAALAGDKTVANGSHQPDTHGNPDPGQAAVHLPGSAVPDNVPPGLPAPAQASQAAPQTAGGLAGQTLWDFGTGLAHGIQSVPDTVEAAIYGAARKLGVGDDTIQRAAQIAHGGGNPTLSGLIAGQSRPSSSLLDLAANAKPYDQNGLARGAGNMAGEMLATAPITELKPFQMAGEIGGVSGKLGNALHRYMDMGLQGAGFAAATSRGEDVGDRMAWGAVGAPLLGGVIDVGARPFIAGAQKIGESAIAQKIAAALRDKAGLADTSPVSPVMDDATYRARLSELLTAKNFDRKAVEDFITSSGHTPVGSTGAALDYVAQHPGHGGDVQIVDLTPGKQPVTTQATPDQLAAAIGNKAAESGIEATRDLPANVASDFQRLKSQGVPEAEALREADIRGVGAMPTVGAVRRSPEDMSAMFEGAKQPTPEGQALSQQLAQNNAALHARVQEMVGANGGVPAQGEVAQAASEALAKASDAAKAKVTAAYDAARAADGDLRVDPSELRAVLADPVNRAAVTNEGSSFISGMARREGILNPDVPGQPRQGLAGLWDRLIGRSPAGAPRGMTMAELEQLRQAANDAYDQTGAAGERNGLIRKVKTAIDAAQDRLSEGSASYKAARALHKQWAEQYDDPAGIEGLIRRDAKGNFVNSDNWRATGNSLIGTTSDKAFTQVVRQLQKLGDTATLGRLKADVIQRAYKRASNNAADQAGNAAFSAKQWFAELNKIGMPKLEALFSREEIASLAHVGRAAVHMNEAIPGTVNTSNTASALIKALGLQGKGAAGPAKTIARVLGHGVSLATHPIVGNVLVEQAAKGADSFANRRAGKALADALREQMNPDSARAAEAARAKRATDAANRAALARQLSNRLAPTGANQRGH